MFKNVASQKIQLFAFDITTGAPKTGDAANITAYVSKDHGAVTVLTDTSATEMDATNAKGIYVFDVAQAETNADELTFSAKSSTANISITPRFISTNPANFTAASIDSNGRVDVIKVAGTTQTARDIGASVLVAGDLSATMKTSVQTAADAAVTANTLINTMAGYIDTEVAAIKAKTDNLPASPAATGDAMTLTAGERNSVADALLARNVAGGSSAGRLVKEALYVLRNKTAIAAGTMTVYGTDDTTAAFTAAVTTSAGDPISTIDPA